MASMNITVWDDIETMQSQMSIDDYVCQSGVMSMFDVGSKVVQCLLIASALVLLR